MNRKRIKAISAFLVLAILLGSAGLSVPARAAKEQEKRSIAIVFDNSGSMYYDGNTAWARATYATEVFASMLNEGDTLAIFPMNPIEAGGGRYDMDLPLGITGPTGASKIRGIFTPGAGDTHIESLARAHDYLMKESGKRWLIVLTDGDNFYLNKSPLGKEKSKAVLKDDYLEPYSRDVNVLYLGIGGDAIEPDCAPQGEYELLVKKESDTSRILACLTEMCNMIFGRDTLPNSHFADNTLDLDVSVNKLIVLVQGDNLSDVTLTGPDGAVKPVSEYATRYPENGAGARYEGKCKTDTSLQGMVTTYTDLQGGKYRLSYSGTASSAEVYYEPNVDLEFTFTDEDGRRVDLKDLYEGSYKLSFGMKDGRTGEYTDSELIGDSRYEGRYFINDQQYDISCADKSGSESVYLKMDDRFNADMLVTYLSGYRIYKDSSDFGWPEFGLTVKPRPAGELKLTISGGQAKYGLTVMEEGEPFRAEVSYKGSLLTGEELGRVELTWDPDLSGAELRKILQGDHYDIVLLYKDPDAPEKTEIGAFSVPVHAQYLPPASEEAFSPYENIEYSIEDDHSPFGLKLTTSQDYYVIGKLAEGAPIRVELTENGGRLTPEQFGEVVLTVDCGGIDHDTELLPQESAALIRLRPTDGLGAGSYTVRCSASLADRIGRVYSDEDETAITLSTLPRWVKLAAALLLALLLLLIILAILHIKALPTKLHTNKKQCRMEVEGDDVTANAQFNAALNKKRVVFGTKYAGSNIGLAMDVKPGKKSYIKTPQAKRTAVVAPQSVVKQGTARVDEALIGTTKYVRNEETNRLERMPNSSKPFNLKNGMTVVYRGVIDPSGDAKSFTSTVRLNFKKTK